jgi:glycosyltransferase involved in cell wall biosynthesis
MFDSFSTDDTCKIAKDYNVNLFNHEFDNHRDQKNRAIEQCNNEWVFLLDADEYCSNALVDHLNGSLIPQLEQYGIDAFGLPRYNLEDGAGPRGWPDIQTRLFKKYCRHVGHPFHHQTTGYARNPAIDAIPDPDDQRLEVIYHDKTSAQQRERNRLYYYMRPGDYKTVPEGAEGMIVPPENYQERLNVNVFQEFIKKQGA